MRYLQVQQKKSALVGTSLWAGDGGLPVTAVTVERRSLDALGRVRFECLQLAAQPPVSPRVLFYWGRALEDSKLQCTCTVSRITMKCDMNEVSHDAFGP